MVVHDGGLGVAAPQEALSQRREGHGVGSLAVGEGKMWWSGGSDQSVHCQ